MVKTGKIEIKENITEFDYSNVVDFITFFVVGITQEGEKYYRPYYMNTAIICAVAKYLITGVEFEEGENPYVAVMNDEEVRNEVYRFVDNFEKEMKQIETYVEDTIEFHKQCVIHTNPSIDEEVIEILNLARESIEKEKAVNEAGLKTMELQNKILDYQNKVNEQFTPEESAELTRKMAANEFDSSKIADLIADKYFSSDKHVEKLEEVIEDDKAKIRDLSTYKKLHDARNVLNDGKE